MTIQHYTAYCKLNKNQEARRAFPATIANGITAITMKKWVRMEARFTTIFGMSSADLRCVRSLHMRPETMAAAARCMKHSVHLSTDPLLMLGMDAMNPTNVTLISSSDALGSSWLAPFFFSRTLVGTIFKNASWQQGTAQPPRTLHSRRRLLRRAQPPRPPRPGPAASAEVRVRSFDESYEQFLVPSTRARMI
jgi:hypothetical protein